MTARDRTGTTPVTKHAFEPNPAKKKLAGGATSLDLPDGVEAHVTANSTTTTARPSSVKWRGAVHSVERPAATTSSAWAARSSRIASGRSWYATRVDHNSITSSDSRPPLYSRGVPPLPVRPSAAAAGLPVRGALSFTPTYNDDYTGWPLAPKHRTHAVYGTFLNPTTGWPSGMPPLQRTFHRAIDILVNDATGRHPVFAIEGGSVRRRRGSGR